MAEISHKGRCNKLLETNMSMRRNLKSNMDMMDY